MLFISCLFVCLFVGLGFWGFGGFGSRVLLAREGGLGRCFIYSRGAGGERYEWISRGMSMMKWGFKDRWDGKRGL